MFYPNCSFRITGWIFPSASKGTNWQLKRINELLFLVVLQLDQESFLLRVMMLCWGMLFVQMRESFTIVVAIFRYMSGNTISIFPIMMVIMLVFRPIKTLFSVGSTFKALDASVGGPGKVISYSKIRLTHLFRTAHDVWLVKCSMTILNYSWFYRNSLF